MQSTNNLTSDSSSERVVRDAIAAIRLIIRKQPGDVLPQLDRLLDDSSVDNHELHTEILILRANCYELLRNQSAAESDILTAIALWDSVADGMPPTLRGELYYLWSGIANQQGRIRPSLERCLQSLGARREVGEPLLLAETLNKMASILIEAGDYITAEPYLVEALKIAQDAGLEPQETQVLSNIAVIKSLGGREEEAAEYFARCAKKHHAMNNRVNEVRALANLASTYADMQRFDQAQKACQEAIQIMELLPDCTVEPWIRAVEAHLNRERGQWDAADTAAQIGIERALTLASVRHIPILFAERGLIASARNDFNSARAFLQKALAESERMNRDSVTVDIYRRLAEVAEKQEDYKAALAYYQRFHNMSQEAQKEAADRRLEATLATLQVERAMLAAESARKEAEMMRAHQRHLQRLSEEDPLTGLFNRRYLDNYLKDAVPFARATSAPISVAIFDLDNFKKVNDRFSHQMGDFVLKEAARILRENARESDIVARFGGEEFVLVLPGVKLQGAAVICERIRVAIAEYPWHEAHPDLVVTTSIGVCDDPHATNYEQLLIQADKRLYRAKHAGKNRVVTESD